DEVRDVAAVLEGAGGGVAGGDPPAEPEEAEVAAAPAARDVVGVLAGERSEVLAGEDPLAQPLDGLARGGGVGGGVALDADEDVGGADVRRAVAAVLDPDEVVAEPGAQRAGDLADGRVVGGLLERLDHPAAGEVAEVAAVAPGRGVLGVPEGEVVEGDA